VGGLERIGDAEQVVALLVQSEVSLVNLKLLTVDELAATGVGEAVACELLSQLGSLEQSPRGSPTDE
jgi:2C-methyl-D-erythritol 2,4-cyclodiphosphate synthase